MGRKISIPAKEELLKIAFGQIGINSSIIIN